MEHKRFYNQTILASMIVIFIEGCSIETSNQYQGQENRASNVCHCASSMQRVSNYSTAKQSTRKEGNIPIYHEDPPHTNFKTVYHSYCQMDTKGWIDQHERTGYQRKCLRRFEVARERRCTWGHSSGLPKPANSLYIVGPGTFINSAQPARNPWLQR